MPGLRQTQRVPLRCTECARRRIKCTKNIPCDSCIKSRTAHLCHREVVLVRGKPMLGDNSEPSCHTDGGLIQENSALRERIAHLEAIIQGKDHSRPQASQSRDTPRQQQEHGEFEVISGILEQWNHGATSQELSQAQPLETALPEDLIATLNLLPQRADGRLIARFSLGMFGWIHCALDSAAFFEEFEIVHDCLESGQWETLRNHAWMAVYLSVLTVGLTFMEGTEQFNELSLEFVLRSDFVSLPHMWYRAALRQLELFDFLARPKLQTIQAIAILNLYSRHLGQRVREINLIAIAISTARTLRMHMLGNEDTCPPRVRRLPQWSSRATREVGRRLWWTLIVCDWLGSIFEAPLISANSFNCELSEGDHDAAHILGNSPGNGILINSSPLWHHMAISQLASIIHAYVERQDRSSVTLLETLKRLSDLEERTRETTQDNAEEQIWVLGQKYHYLLTLNHLRLKLCRVLFHNEIEPGPAYDEIRNLALSAATAICDTAGKMPHIYKRTWIFSSSTIGSGVFLGLDLLKLVHFRDVSIVKRREAQISSCLSTIAPYQHKTAICRGGVRILERLLGLIRQYGVGRGQVNILKLIIELDHDVTPRREASPFERPTTEIQSPVAKEGESFYDPSTAIHSLAQYSDPMLLDGGFTTDDFWDFGPV